MTMHCHEAELLLSEFAAGELDGRDAGRVARHLAGCEACRAEADRELKLRELLGGLPTIAASAGLAEVGNLEKVSEPQHRGRPRWPAVGSLVAAAITLAVLLPSTAPRVPDPLANVEPVYSVEEVAAARRDALFGLVLAARIIERTERHTVADVFGRQLPQAVTESLGSGTAVPEGGQG